MFTATPSSGPAQLVVRFHGTATLIPPYEAETWSWNFGDGATGEGRSTIHTYTVPGTYTATLEVAAAAAKFRGEQDPPPVTLTYSRVITVLNPNRPPVANAGPDQSVYLPTGAQPPPVQLDGSGSYDPDDDPLTYAWQFVSVPGDSKSVALTGANTVNPTFFPESKGNYVIQLIVNDGQVDSEPDTVVVTVGNRPPVANAGPDQSIFLDEEATLDGSASSDPDGDSLTYAWTVVTSPAGSTPVLTGAATVGPTFSADQKGDYVIQLIVNDGTVDSAPDTVTVTIGNRPPVADAGPDQSLFLGLIGQFPAVLVTLDGSGSSDPDGDSLTYAWTFVTVPAGSAAALTGAGTENPTFTADLKGDYVIQLIVNDGTVDSAPDTVVVTIGNRPPVADAGPDQGDLFLDEEVTLDGNGSYDPDYDSLMYAWTFVTVPDGSAAALTGVGTANPTFTADLKGDYVIQLIVNDGTVDSAPDTVTVTIVNRPPTAVGVVLPVNEPMGNVYADTGSPVLTPDLEMLYGLQRWSIIGEKAFGPPFNLLQIDPDTAFIEMEIPITLIVDGGGYLEPMTVSDAKGLAVDPTNGEMWAILGFRPYYMTSGVWWALARVNPYTGVAVAVGDPLNSSLPELYAGLAVDDLSVVYGVTGNGGPQKAVDTRHALYEIDKTDTSETFLFQFPEPPDVNRTPGEVIAFNTDDGLMYHATASDQGEAAGRLFRALDLGVDPFVLTGVTLTPDDPFWNRPTAMTYGPGSGEFYLADVKTETATLFRMTLSGSTATEEYIGEIRLDGVEYWPPPVKGLAFLYDRTFPAPEVTLDGSQSSDPDGDDLTYAWQFVDVPVDSGITNSDLSNASGETTSFTPDVQGTYVLELVVNDGEENSDPATVTVNYLNTPPVANAGADQLLLAGQMAVQLNGGDSYDPDGDVLTFAWSFVSAPPGSTIGESDLMPDSSAAAPTFFADVANVAVPYVLELTVTDADGATSTDTVEVTIEELN